jgi:mono/diheme cytochrome c family protein
VRATLIALAVVLAGAVAGWVGAAQQAPPAPAPPGKAVYDAYCAACHGAEGRGDGQSAANLPIKPWDLTDGRLMNPLPDEFISLTIEKGGPAVGLSPLMPAWSQNLSREQIADVVAYVRSLARPSYTAPASPAPPIYPPNAPAQPILFSHLIHAGAYRIDCQYCHTEARRAAFAGLPSVERCMGCHKIVGADGNPEIKKVQGYWERKEPVPWVWLYRVPEFVHFPHKAHIRAEIACQTCHGRVETTMQIPAPRGLNLTNDLLNLAGLPVPSPTLSMGWCIDCHRTQNETRGMKAPLDCVTCHH